MELATAITSAKATWEVLKTAVDARDSTKIDTATQALREKLLTMTDLAFSYVERNATLTQENASLAMQQVGLEQRIAELEKQIQENSQYALHEFPSGVLALKSAPSEGLQQKPMHYLCLACKNEGKKSVLQPNSPSITFLICQLNKHHSLRTQPPQPSTPRRQTGNHNDFERH